MTKQEAIVNLSAILNRKSSLDEKTIFFENKKHDDLLEIIHKYIENSSFLIGNPKVFKTQALNDHGVDLIVEYPNQCKLGIQIKSHFDVSEKDFALKVKAQLAESKFHGLDKWYLLICSPLNSNDKNYSSKISHLINELSSYKTSYHTIYSPQQCYNIFCGDLMTESEFRNVKNQYYFEEVNWTDIFNYIKSPKKNESFLQPENTNTYDVKTADLYFNFFRGNEDERQSYIDSLNNLKDLLKKLSVKSREFLFVCISRGKKRNFGLHDKIIVSCQDIENFLEINQITLKKQVGVLEDYNLAYIDNIDDYNIYYIVINQADPDYNILLSIKDFCAKCNKNLKEIIVDLNFEIFDK